MKLISLLIAAVTLAEQCLPIAKDCSFYTRCLEPTVPCGPFGYSINYGQKYCESFKKDSPNFSPKGQEWLWMVMTCLQENLLPITNGTISKPTCKGLKTFAYATHAECYTIPGHSVCDIPPGDWVRLLWIIKNELFDVETLKTAIQVNKNCNKE